MQDILVAAPLNMGQSVIQMGNSHLQLTCVAIVTGMYPVTRAVTTAAFFTVSCSDRWGGTGHYVLALDSSTDVGAGSIQGYREAAGSLHSKSQQGRD